MKHDIEPALQTVPIAELRPTQMTLGFREVEVKRAEWRSRAKHDGPDYLGRHMVPVVLGPKRAHYLIDNHHLARALQEEGVKNVLTDVVADLSKIGKSAFWFMMDNRNWLHPFDADGKRLDRRKLPRTLAEMTDDPYRSLAGELRRAGGYAKDMTPYAEFLWADFLRRRIAAKAVEDDFKTVLKEALDLAHQSEAGYLPGWCGMAD
jgi:hypothetical protein